MKLTVINSGSKKGNSYILQNDTEALILDAGCRFSDIQRGLNYDVLKVKGCLITHEHNDHIFSVSKVLKMGIPVYSHKELKDKHPSFTELEEKKRTQIGNFTVIPFYVPHTTRDKETKELIPCPNYAYIILHEEIGAFLYMTDFMYCKYILKRFNFSNILIECNHMLDIDRNSAKYAHVIKGHASVNTVSSFLKKNKTNYLKNVILCHLSEDNGNGPEMIERCKSVVQNANVMIAEHGLEVELEELF